MTHLLAQVSSHAITFDSDQMFVLSIIAMSLFTAVLITVFCVLSSMASSMHKQKTEADLKREMLDRGMSAAEIDTVIKSSKPNDFLDRWADRRR